MKRLLTLTLSLFLVQQLAAQRIQLSVYANGGASWFTGLSAENNSFINFGSNGNNYTNNPYGKKAGFSYGAGLQGKITFKSRVIAGLQGGYEVLNSRVNINYLPVLYTYDPSQINNAAYPTSNAVGHTTLHNYFINLSPFVGYRVLDGVIKLDILPGVDIGIPLKSHENGQAQYQNTSGAYGEIYNTDREREKPKTDLRLKLGFDAEYKRFGVTAAYASGKTNYMNGLIGGGKHEAYSAVARFGLTYRLF